MMFSSKRVQAFFAFVLCVLPFPGWAQFPFNDCVNEAGRDPDKAILKCTAALDTGRLTDYELVHSLNIRGWAYYRKADYDRAIHDYDQALRRKPDYAFVFNNRGLAYASERSYDRAIDDYDQAITLKPGYARAFYNRGNAYSLKGDDGHAIQDFNEAIRLRPDDAEALCARGKAYAGKADFGEAIRDFTQALHLKPDYAEAFKERSEAYMFKHDYKSAVRDLNRAIELRPNDADAISSRGSIHYEMGDFDRAIQDFSQAIRLEPNKVSTHWLRAAVFYDKGDYDAAIRDYNEIIKFQPEVNVINIGEVYQRGLAYLYKGDYEGAIRDFDEAADLKLSYCFYHRGLALFFMGQLEAAKEEFARAGEGPRSDIWLYLAEAKLGEKAKEKLQERAPRINEQLKYWPGPVIRFYLGSMTAAQVLSAAREDDQADKNPCCDEHTAASEKIHYHYSEGAAYFYLAEEALLRTHPKEAISLFQKALLMTSKNTEENHGSMLELKRLIGTTPKPSLPR